MTRVKFSVRSIWLSLAILVPVAVAQSAPAPAGPDEDTKERKALDILKKADQATRAVRSAQYDVTLEGTGWAKNRVWVLQGHVFSRKAADGRPSAFRYTVTKAIAPNTAEELQYTTGSDGTEFFLVDAQTKKVHRGISPVVLGRAGRVAERLPMREFMHATPFTDEITGEKALLMGTETVDGIECHNVYVMYKGGQEANWYFSKKDFLPRRVDRLLRNPQGEVAKRIRTVTNLVVDPTIPEDVFVVQVPEGYEETTENAPDPRIPM